MTRVPRVLVIDDDAVIRTAVADALADEGFAIRVAGDGHAALAVLEAWSADVIVLDLMMPGMDGWAFRREQLLRPGLAGIPVIALSATRDVRAEATRLGAAVALAKPFDLGDLLAHVERLVPG